METRGVQLLIYAGGAHHALLDPVVCWGGGYPLPHSPPLDAYVVSRQLIVPLFVESKIVKLYYVKESYPLTKIVGNSAAENMR